MEEKWRRYARVYVPLTLVCVAGAAVALAQVIVTQRPLPEPFWPALVAEFVVATGWCTPRTFSRLRRAGWRRQPKFTGVNPRLRVAYYGVIAGCVLIALYGVLVDGAPRYGVANGCPYEVMHLFRSHCVSATGFRNAAASEQRTHAAGLLWLLTVEFANLVPLARLRARDRRVPVTV